MLEVFAHISLSSREAEVEVEVQAVMACLHCRCQFLRGARGPACFRLLFDSCSALLLYPLLRWCFH